MTREMYDELQQDLAVIRGIIAANQDNRTKEIGDRVVIWDGSANKDKNTGESRFGVDPLFQKNSAIVIAVNQPITYQFFNRLFKLDLLVVFPSGEEVYVSSELVRIV